jgi:hypothetical protein
VAKVILIFLLALLFTAPRAMAIEYEFDGGQVTALGGITTQPAALGYLDTKYSFSASATSFEYTKYSLQNNSFEQNSAPLAMKPVFVGSAMSTSYGGWSFLVYSTQTEYRANLGSFDGVTTTDSDLTIRSSGFSALVSSALRVHANWSLGWGLVLSQLQTDATTLTANTATASKTLIDSESSTQATQAAMNMGFLYSSEEFVLGFKGTTPPALLARSGKLRTRTVVTGTNTYTDTTENQAQNLDSDWTYEAGVRLGRTGFSYVLSDAFRSNGQHQYKFGFEYVATWGTIASGASYLNYKGNSASKLTVGFVKDHKNFKWGVGPYYQNNVNSDAGALNSRTYGVLYSSEIRY